MNNASEPALSIIIPAYNEESRLPRALAKIRDYLASRRCGPEQAEIIIVDDGSVDGTAAVAEKWNPRVCVVAPCSERKKSRERLQRAPRNPGSSRSGGPFHRR